MSLDVHFNNSIVLIDPVTGMILSYNATFERGWEPMSFQSQWGVILFGGARGIHLYQISGIHTNHSYLELTPWYVSTDNIHLASIFDNDEKILDITYSAYESGQVNFSTDTYITPISTPNPLFDLMIYGQPVITHSRPNAARFSIVPKDGVLNMVFATPQFLTRAPITIDGTFDEFAVGLDGSLFIRSTTGLYAISTQSLSPCLPGYGNARDFLAGWGGIYDPVCSLCPAGEYR